MTSLSSHLKLANLFKAVADGENHAEVSRQVLAERPAFEPYTAFTRLDRDADGFLSIEELLDFFYYNNVEVTKSDAQDFIIDSSASSSNKLTYSDFLNIVLPKTDYKLRQSCIKRATNPVSENEVLAYEVEVALLKVLHKEIQLTRKLEVLREDLVSNCDFSLRDAFYALNQKGIRAVDFDCIQAFFKNHRTFITDGDILSILNRTDLDNDRILNYKSFARIVLPIQTYCKHFVEMSCTKTCVSKSQNFSQSVTVTPKKQVKIQEYQSPYTGSTRVNTTTNSHRHISRTAYISPERSNVSRKVETNTVQGFYSSAKSVRKTLCYTEEYEKDDNEEEMLASAIKKYIRLDRELTKWKNQLALKRDFNLFDAFRLFDREEIGYATESELKRGLKELDIHASYEEIGLLLERYGKQKELSYGDFCNMIVPEQEIYAERLKKRQPTYMEKEGLHQRLSAETREIFKRTVQTLLVNELYNENLRQQMNKKSLEKVWRAFRNASQGQSESVGFLEFKNLMYKHGIVTTEKELTGVISKFDKSGEGRVTFESFREEMRTRSPKRY